MIIKPKIKNSKAKMKAWDITLSTGKKLVMLCDKCETVDDVREVLLCAFPYEEGDNNDKSIR